MSWYKLNVFNFCFCLWVLFSETLICKDKTRNQKLESKCRATHKWVSSAMLPSCGEVGGIGKESIEMLGKISEHWIFLFHQCCWGGCRSSKREDKNLKTSIPWAAVITEYMSSPLPWCRRRHTLDERPAGGVPQIIRPNTSHNFSPRDLFSCSCSLYT